MKIFRLFAILFFAMPAIAATAQNANPYAAYPVYAGKDLGVKYTPQKTIFKVWAPKASDVKLRLYDAGDGGEAINTVDLKPATNGAWSVTVNGDIKNKYY